MKLIQSPFTDLLCANTATLPVLLYVGNPVIALLVGAAIVLVFDRTPFPATAYRGKYALQSAIVLLGLKLNPGQLLQISGDYSLLVSGYVILTLVAGLLLGRWFRSIGIIKALWYPTG